MGLRTIVDAASLKANQWVQGFQNPFGTELSTIYDPIEKAQQAGTLTLQQVQDALNSFNTQWSGFQQAAKQYQAQGGDWNTVISQSLDPGGEFMKTVNMVQTNLTNWQTQLQAGMTGANPNTPNAPPTMSSILSELGLTPADAARSAAVTQRRQAMAAPGFTGTILGGAGLKQNVRTPTLLGF